MVSLIFYSNTTFSFVHENMSFQPKRQIVIDIHVHCRFSGHVYISRRSDSYISQQTRRELDVRSPSLPSGIYERRVHETLHSGRKIHMYNVCLLSIPLVLYYNAIF